MDTKPTRQLKTLGPAHQQLVRAYTALIRTLLLQRNRDLEVAERIREMNGPEAADMWLALQSDHIRDQAHR